MSVAMLNFYFWPLDVSSNVKIAHTWPLDFGSYWEIAILGQ